MNKAEREEKLRLRLLEMKTYEEEIESRGFKYIAGVDEVGRGPLAGPVVAACAVLSADFDVLGVDDSKKLSEKKREALFDEIKEKFPRVKSALIHGAMKQEEKDRIMSAFEDGDVVTAEALLSKGILKKCPYGYKVLGNGKVTKKLTVEASAFSQSAKEAIEAAGGKAEVK